MEVTHLQVDRLSDHFSVWRYLDPEGQKIGLLVKAGDLEHLEDELPFRGVEKPYLSWTRPLSRDELYEAISEPEKYLFSSGE